MPKLKDIKSGTALPERRYSNRRASYLGDTLVSGGRIESVNPDTREVEFSLFVRLEGGEVTAPGRAIVRLNA
jgi:3-methylfumaryl-CoA hydratase